METVKIAEFLEQGTGYGYGSDDGYGSGHGYGDGSGYGSGSGDGYGDGSGYGSGSGDGYGYGSGYGIDTINGACVRQIDGVQTVIHHVHGSVAKGAILKDDLTLEPCYIVKGGGFFAHGETLREAMEALADKILEDMPEEERLERFVEAHPAYRTPYPNRDLYEWHHRLTGSCEMGRNEFVSSKGLSLDGQTTVEEFVALTKDAYGGNIIQKLPSYYKEELK